MHRVILHTLATFKATLIKHVRYKEQALNWKESSVHLGRKGSEENVQALLLFYSTWS